MNGLAHNGIINVVQQEDSSDHLPQLFEGKIQFVFAAVRAQTFEQCRRGDPSQFDRDHHPEHIWQVFTNKLKIDAAAKQRVNVLVLGVFVRPEKPQVVNVTNQLKSQSPTPQNISRDMFRRIHPSQKNSANVNDHAEMQSLPTRPGCYAVIHDKQVLYVGASSNLRERCHRFIGKGEIADRLYFWLWRYPYSLEYILISFLVPKDNCHGKYNKFPTICAWNGKFREELDI